MTCEHLICARCSGPVVEGRCTTCRAARAEMHHSHSNLLSPMLLAALLLVVLLLLVTHLPG